MKSRVSSCRRYLRFHAPHTKTNRHSLATTFNSIEEACLIQGGEDATQFYPSQVSNFLAKNKRKGSPAIPYQAPSSMWKVLNNFLPSYQQDTRGGPLSALNLYLLGRTMAPPNMIIFDTRTRDACATRRQLTNTPLQPINPSKNKFTPGAVHVHDLHATILHQLGIDHTRLTYTAQGRRFGLTDVDGHVVQDLLA